MRYAQILLAVLAALLLFGGAAEAGPRWFGHWVEADTSAGFSLTIENTQRGTIFSSTLTPDSNGTLDSATFYLKSAGTAGYNYTVKYGLYAYAGTGTELFVDTTAQFTKTTGSNNGYATVAFDLKASVTAGTRYVLLAWGTSDGSTRTLTIPYNTATGESQTSKSSTPGAWPSTYTGYSSVSNRAYVSRVWYTTTPTGTRTKKVRTISGNAWLPRDAARHFAGEDDETLR